MKARTLPLLLLVALAAVAGTSWWISSWMEKRPVNPAGGLYFPKAFLIEVPHFSQADPQWAGDLLGSTPSSLAAEGCAVASSAMALAARGVDVDPGRLNTFLIQTPEGYTPEGWITWEKAAEFDPAFTSKLLPHYEDDPSYFLIDWNLIHSNPVIARLRTPQGITHFVVICGKAGFDYLVQDPGRGGDRGIYPLKEFGSPIEAIRFYQRE